MSLTGTNPIHATDKPVATATMAETRAAILAAVSDAPGTYSPEDLMQHLYGARWNNHALQGVLLRQAFWALLSDGLIRLLQPSWTVGLPEQPRRQAPVSSR